jgi:hypothetical protein
MVFHFQAERSDMSSVSEAQTLVQRVAAPREATDSVKAAIVRAARRLGWKFTRTREIWYGHARRIDAAEMDALREAAGRMEARLLISNLLVMRERLSKTDADFNQPQIVALDNALRSFGISVCPVAVPTEE